jgi:hypothetical protein
MMISLTSNDLNIKINNVVDLNVVHIVKINLMYQIPSWIML